MKTNKNLWFTICVILLLVISACSDNIEKRLFEGSQIVGVNVNGVLYLPNDTSNIATVLLPAGTDLSNVKVELLVTNGSIQGFANNTQMDCRKPLSLTINGSDGKTTGWTLKIQSPPLITSLIISGLTIDPSDIHFGSSSLIVQVPKGTNLAALNVTMDFVNGSLQDFTNGTVQDYTLPHTIHVLSVDGTSIYAYQFIITTQNVGPALISSMTINGIPTDSVVVTNTTNNTVVPYVHGLSNFTNANVKLTAGVGNQIDPSFTGQGLNLLAGTTTVKIIGTDGVQKTFTIGVPQLSLNPLCSIPYASFGFGSDAGSAIAFSGKYFVVANNNSAGVTPIGPNYYDLSGNWVNALSKTGTTIDGGAVTGIRKLAADDNGEILGVQLGAGAGATTTLNIYKWNGVTDAAPIVYISYSQTSLGLSYVPRAAGINISGSLSGNAIITVPMAKNQDVLVWTVTNGVLTSSMPQKLTFPYTATGYYYGVQPLPIGSSGFVGAATGLNFNGIISLTSVLISNFQLTGIVTTDCDTYSYNGRIYLAYTAYASGQGAHFRVCDITDGQAKSFQNPIMDVLMPSTAANANTTTDAALSIVNGKLCAAFICTNIGAKIYQLQP